MANLGAIESELNGVPATIRTRLLSAFREIVKNGIRFGRAEAEGSANAENFAGGLVSGRTAENAGDEFSLEHGLGRAPYLIVPILPLIENMQTVSLVVSRAPDARRVYFTSTDEDAPYAVFIEG